MAQRVIAPACLVIGSLFGMAGTFAPAPLRGLAWGLDGTALIVATAILAVHHLRRGNETVAAGFLVFLVAEALIVSGSAMDLTASAPIFAAGAGLWAASLVLVSLASFMPFPVRVLGLIAAVLFAVVAVQIYMARPLTALTQPLPFFAYPFLVATLIGWAWVHYKRAA
jgi:hypothetical protein